MITVNDALEVNSGSTWSSIVENYKFVLFILFCIALIIFYRRYVISY